MNSPKQRPIIILTQKQQLTQMMDPRHIQYEGWLKTLRYILLGQGIVLMMLSILFGRINGFVYIFIILNSIFLFCEINLKHTYQFLIVMGLFILIKEIIEFLMFLFYRPQEDKLLNPMKPTVIYVLSIFILLKLILVTWRHFQNKLFSNNNFGQNDDFVDDF